MRIDQQPELINQLLRENAEMKEESLSGSALQLRPVPYPQQI